MGRNDRTSTEQHTDQLSGRGVRELDTDEQKGIHGGSANRVGLNNKYPENLRRIARYDIGGGGGQI